MNDQEIYLIGGGTLAEFVIDILSRSRKFTVAGIFDDTLAKGSNHLGLNVIGGLADIDLIKPRRLAIAVGKPQFRENVFEAHPEMEFPSIIDPSAIISKRAHLEDGVIIGPNASVLSGSRIGRGSCVLAHVNINQNVTMAGFCLIGAGAIIGNEAVIGRGSHIGLGTKIKLGQEVPEWSDISE